MYFLNEDHVRNFENLFLKDGTSHGDTERAALFYILAGNNDLFLKRTAIYDFKEKCIMPNVLTEGDVDFCSSSKALLALAFNLYNGHREIYDSPYDLLSSLDHDNYRLAKGAMDLRFTYGLSEAVLKAIEEEDLNEEI